MACSLRWIIVLLASNAFHYDPRGENYARMNRGGKMLIHVLRHNGHPIRCTRKVEVTRTTFSDSEANSKATHNELSKATDSSSLYSTAIPQIIVRTDQGQSSIGDNQRPETEKMEESDSEESSEQGRSSHNSNHEPVVESKRKPVPPDPETCCESGCVNCVWIKYAEEVNEYYPLEERPAKLKVIIDNVEDFNVKMFLKMELGL